MTKMTNGFLIFTLTSYNESLATRQGLGCDVIARVDGRRSLAQNGRVDTEAQGERGRQGDKGTRGKGEKTTGKFSTFCLVPLSPCLHLPLSLSVPPSGLKIRIEGLKKIWKKRYEEKLKLS